MGRKNAYLGLIILLVIGVSALVPFQVQAASPQYCRSLPTYFLQITVPGYRNPYAAAYYSARFCYNGSQIAGTPTFTTSTQIYSASAKYISTNTVLISNGTTKTYRTTIQFSVRLSATNSVWRAAWFQTTFYPNGQYSITGGQQ